MATLRAVFFDVDGVLLDSLPQHLAFCKQKALEFGLPQVRIPSIVEFKKMVRSGIPVSPMLNFFLAVGFPPPFAKRAVRDYETDFSALFPPKPFAGVGDMLTQLRGAGFYLGLVTANVRKNVEPPLHQYLWLFDPRCLFFFDPSAPRNDKQSSLLKGSEVLHLRTLDCVFVGDQPADAMAAQAARFQFLGVSYGWGFSRAENADKILDSVDEIAPALIAASGR